MCDVVDLYFFVLFSCFVQTKAHSAEQFGQADLVGTWQQIAWRTDEKNSEFTPESPYIRIIKLYTASHFSFTSYLPNGHVFSSMGGTYSWRDDGTLVEEVEYYIADKPINMGFAQDGRGTLMSAASMAQSMAELKVHFEQGEMRQTGVHRQNQQSLPADHYRDFFIDRKFRKVE